SFFEIKVFTHNIQNASQRKKEILCNPFIKALCDYAGDKKAERRIIQETEYLKVNSASSKPVKACKKLNIHLSKFVGSFMADGSLSIQVVFAAENKNEISKTAHFLSEKKQHFSQNYSP
ncbi:MAG: hypothetical protein QXK06_04710, partial [Candidatus Diapherotrites archaeon]